MESIVQFTFPALTYKCSLNPRGRRRYGTLEELLLTQTGIVSTVGMPDGTNQVQNDIRNSVRYTSVVEFDIYTESVLEHLAKLVSDDNEAEWTSSSKYDVIEYKTGGFFREHQDAQRKPNHYGTLLIFPPAVGEFAHTGGELVLDRGKFRFDSSKNTEWTFIAFQTNLFHECKEVLSGRRIVLKTELYSKNYILTRGRDPFGVVD
jgi:hypothetical protein